MNLFRLDTKNSKLSLPRKRKKTAWQPDYLFDLLDLQPLQQFLCSGPAGPGPSPEKRSLPNSHSQLFEVRLASLMNYWQKPHRQRNETGQFFLPMRRFLSWTKETHFDAIVP